MNDLDFKTFLNERIREKSISLQKLSELTNIAPANLEHLVEGKYNELPPAPYVHGYIEKLSPILGFDAGECWEMLKRERSVKIAGVLDSLPTNRFARVFPLKIAAAIIATIMIVIFVALRLPEILGVPTITLANPISAVSTVNVAQMTFEGSLQNGDTLTINEGNVPIHSDGTWTQTVALQPGQNNFEIKASKLLGRNVTLIRQIVYEVPQATPASNTLPNTPLPSSTPNGTSSHTPTTSTP